jgi:hypothetical protein
MILRKAAVSETGEILYDQAFQNVIQERRCGYRAHLDWKFGDLPAMPGTVELCHGR